MTVDEFSKTKEFKDFNDFVLCSGNPKGMKDHCLSVIKGFISIGVNKEKFKELSGIDYNSDGHFMCKLISDCYDELEKIEQLNKRKK